MIDREMLRGAMHTIPALAQNIVMITFFDALGTNALIRVTVPIGRLSPSVEKWIKDFAATGRVNGDDTNGDDELDDPAFEDQENPRDCVQTYPSLVESYLLFIGYDGNGMPLLTVEVPAATWSAGLMRWMLKFVRSDVSTPLDSI